MTNEHHDLPSTSTAPGAGYEGFDPDLPDSTESSRFLGLSPVQIGASALAAVTSALAASFFGVAGTLIGAAVGSVVSTVAGAMYAESLRRTRDRLRAAPTVVVQRVPRGSETKPMQLPQPDTMTEVIPARAPETLVLPGQADHGAAADPARSWAALTDAPQPGRPWWRRPLVALSLVGVIGFVIALAVITGIEGITGHTVSGGKGTSLSKLGRSSPQSPAAPAVTSSPGPSDSTPSPSLSSSEPPAQAPQPTGTPEPTPQPSSSSSPASTTPPPATSTPGAGSTAGPGSSLAPAG